MLDNPSAPRFGDGEDRWDHPRFTASPRALTVCSRELGHLLDGIEGGVAALHASCGTETPAQRRSPGRCIVQLGPVALTVAWLRHTLDSVADGELLVAVWHGAVAPKLEHCPERVRAMPAARTATAVWEEVLTVAAESEESWRWCPAPLHAGGYTSAALAERCVERLRHAYEESHAEVHAAG